jgi:DNA-binding PucR family transcriptional regulator
MGELDARARTRIDHSLPEDAWPVGGPAIVLSADCVGRSKDRRDGPAILRQLATAVDDATIDPLADAMVDAMCKAVPELAADSDLQAIARAASHATAHGFVTSLRGDAWASPEVPASLIELAGTMAARRFDVTVLIKLTRYGQAVYWPALMAAVESGVDDSAGRMRALTTVYERFGQYLEQLLDRALAAFQQERDRRLRGAQARRDETIRALLSGETVNAERATRILGYELRCCQTALVLWDSGTGQESLDPLDVFAREFAAALGSRRILTSPSGSRGVWAWIGTEYPPRSEERGRASRLVVPAGVRVTVGHSDAGVDGFARSHQEALAAEQIALASPSTATITWYADVEIVSLLAHDRPRMLAFVRRELAGLAARDATGAKLRATTLAYLQGGCSATAASRDLGAHKNTVRYRVAQVEEILGRQLHGQELRLQLALMLVSTIGDSLLPEPVRRR